MFVEYNNNAEKRFFLMYIPVVLLFLLLSYTQKSLAVVVRMRGGAWRCLAALLQDGRGSRRAAGFSGRVRIWTGW